MPELTGIGAVPQTHRLFALPGTGGLLRSEDNGKTWAEVRQRAFDGYQDSLQFVRFFDEYYGWIGGESGVLLNTTDGGTTWTRRVVPGNGGPIDFSDAQFISRREGWIFSQGIIRHTTDGGENWQVVSSNTLAYAVHFQSAARAFGILDAPALAGQGDAAGFSSDGGRNWKVLTDLPRDGLAFFFLDQDHGWLWDNPGRVWTTLDGGENWSPISSVPGHKKCNIVFATPAVGWAIQDNGDLFGTSDGGRSWSLLRDDMGTPVKWIHVTNSQNVFFAYPSGRILSTADGGKTWSYSTQPQVKTLAFADARHGFASTDDGDILRTEDSGVTWQRTNARSTSSLNAAYLICPTANEAWFSNSDENTIQHTTDGGLTWKTTQFAKGKSVDILAGGTNGIWVYALGHTIYFIDRGLGRKQINLEKALSAPRMRPFELSDIFFLDEKNGWITGAADAGTKFILRTWDGGKTWTRIEKPVTENTYHPTTFHFVNQNDGFGSGFENMAVTTRDGGKTWQGLDTEDITAFSTLAPPEQPQIIFTDAQHGWGITSNGIFATSNRGISWTRQYKDPVNAEVSIAQSHTGPPAFFATGPGISTLTYSPETRQWIKTTLPPRHGLAPWYYIVCLVWLLMLGFVLRRDLALLSGPPLPSIEEIFAPDSPLRPGDTDALGLTALARGMSHFLRNSATTPPFTLAINGAWGSGKTSLMNLLKADLESHGQRTVWFNAWHHQQEDHLLAALLQNILDQAIPKVTSRPGLALRFKLLWRRAARYWPGAILLCAIFVTAAGFLWKDPAANVQYLANSLAGLQHASDSLQNAVGLASKKADAGKSTEKAVLSGWTALQSGGLFAVMWSGVFGPLIALYKNWRPFATAPYELLVAAAPGSKSKDLATLTGFRERFATEFHDVTKALQPLRLTIFIDDLDRCPPDRVMTVLEATNFLAASGDCFIVMGIAREQVKRAVAMSNLEITEMIDPADEDAKQNTASESASPEERKRRTALAYAENYLEKLINLEVCVPALNAQNAGQMLPQEAVRQEEAPHGPLWRFTAGLISKLRGSRTAKQPGRFRSWLIRSTQWLRWKESGSADGSQPKPYIPALTERERARLRWMRKAVIAFTVLCLAGTLTWTGYCLSPAKPEANPLAAVPVPTAQPQPSAQPTKPGATPAVTTGPTATPTAIPNVTLQSAQSPTAFPSTYFGPLLFMLILGPGAAFAWIVGREERQRRAETENSPEFVNALIQLQPFIVSQAPTPRQIKRFLNRVRYYAMNRRAHEPSPPWDERIWLNWKNRGRAKTEEQKRDETTWHIDEGSLVALAAIAFVKEEWIEDADLFANFPVFRENTLNSSGLPWPTEFDLPIRLTTNDEVIFKRLAAGVKSYDTGSPGAAPDASGWR